MDKIEETSNEVSLEEEPKLEEEFDLDEQAPPEVGVETSQVVEVEEESSSEDLTENTNISRVSSTNNHIFDIIWNVGDDEPVKQLPEDQHRPVKQLPEDQHRQPLISQPSVKIRRKKYDIVQEYSEYSTVAGLLYVFMRDQTRGGKIFWIFVIFMMLLLGAYWTASIYKNWQAQPVVTTLTTNALPISEIEFPSVTICGQGFNSEIFCAAFFRLYMDFQREKYNITFPLSPIVASNLYSRMVIMKQPVTPQEAYSVYQFAGFLAKGWGNFLNQSFPGLPTNINFTSLGMLVGLQISKDPDSTIRGNAVYKLISQGLSMLELWLNPNYLNHINNYTGANEAYYTDLFKRLDRKGSFPSYFASLWHSTLPCYDLNGLTATKDGDSSLLKKCLWKGISIPCAAIFQKFPTDRGMCCTFNRAAAEDIFIESAYARIMDGLKTSDGMAAFQNASLPQWFVESGEPNTRTGINSGLTLYLDAHTDKIEAGSITSDIQGFNALIAPRADFPLTFQKGFEVKPGHKNLIALSATKIDSDPAIRHIEPIRRNCRFPEESEELRLHKNYSQASCFLECSLSYAQKRVKEARNTSYTCTPWFFPFSDEDHIMCDPWESAEVVSIMEHKIPKDECSRCLPDCSRTIYQYTASFQPFRKCDEKNFGVSEMCNLEMTSTLPRPHIFGTQVLDQLNSTNGSDPGSIPVYAANVTSSRRFLKRTMVMANIFEKLDREYDAYESDIAMLNIYFDAVSVMQFGTQESQGWIDFFSNVGGLLGLCIGLSIVTIIELIWLCCRLIGNHFRPPHPPGLSGPSSGYKN